MKLQALQLDLVPVLLCESKLLPELEQGKRGVKMSYTTLRLAPDTDGIAQGARMLRDGQLVAFPTETVYGLGADARNDMAVAGIFAAKNRPRFNPLIVHVADIAMAETLVEIPDDARPLCKFWPGPLTLVLPKRHNSGLSDLVTAGLDTVAIRVPAHPIARKLLQTFDGPVAAPSANPSGLISPTSADHVLEGLTGLIGGVIDGGNCNVGVESTIIGFSPTPTLLRAGGLPREEIENVLGLVLSDVQPGKISAPGQLASHYAPNAKVRLNAQKPENEAWLGFGRTNFPVPSRNLSETGDLREAAANLFAHLRALDKLAAEHGLNSIAVAEIPETGLGEAINDRLRRAAAPR